MANLITAQEVKDQVGLRANLDVAKLNPYIPHAQRDSLAQEISFDLYNQIVTENDADDLTPANQTLLDDYIKPYLAFMVTWFAVDFIQWDLSDLGLQVSDDESAISADYKDVKAYKANLNNHAQSMLQDTRMFILDNIADYPDYNPIRKRGNMTKRSGIVFYKTSSVRDLGSCTTCQQVSCICNDEC